MTGMHTGRGLAIAVIIWGAALRLSEAAPARVDELHGTVEKRSVSALGWEKVFPGDKIEEGSTIRTGTDSQADILTEQGHHCEARGHRCIRPHTARLHAHGDA